MSAQGEDLLAWLTDAIIRREETASPACNGGEGRWHSGWCPEDELEEGETSGSGVSDERDRTVVYDEGYPSKAQSVHIALNDPESVLRRCAADRKLLELHQPDGSSCGVCAAEEQADEDSEGEVSWSRWALPFPCPTVVAIAEGYGWTGSTDLRPGDGAQTSPSKGDQVT